MSILEEIRRNNPEMFKEPMKFNQKFLGCNCVNGLECHKTKTVQLFGKDIEVSQHINVLEKDDIPAQTQLYVLNSIIFDKLKAQIQIGEDNSKNEILKNHLYKVNNKYQMLYYISRGSFGITCKVKNLEDGKEYVMKILKTRFNKDFILDEIVNNIAASNGPYICKIIETFNDPKNALMYIIMDVCGNMEMFDAVLLRLDVDVTQKYKWISQLTQALEFCHCIGVLHLDIKPENIVLECDKETKKCGDIRLIDFGLSLYAGNGAKNEDDIISINVDKVVGTPSHVSWEQWEKVRKKERNFTRTNYDDVWAVVMTMYFILYGNRPSFVSSDHRVNKPDILDFSQLIGYGVEKDKVHSNIFKDVFVHENIKTIKQFIKRLKKDGIWKL